MGKSAPKAPPAPDPAATAQAQAAANKESAIATSELAMVNQDTPYGSLEYTPRGESAAGTPQYTATQTLAPAQQQQLELTNQAGVAFGQTANAQLDNVRGSLEQPLSYDSLGAAPQANEQTRQNVRDSMIARLQPDFDRDREALNSQLANQGIGYGSNAYDDAFRTYDNSVNDARLSADVQAGNQMAQQYGLERSARDSAINEMAQQRQIPLNELAAMLSGSQVQGPTFVSPQTAQIAPADIMGATYASYNGDNGVFGTNVGAQTANNQGLFSLLGSGAMAGGMAYGKSDRRLKTDIKQVGVFKGLAVYTFRYIWGGPTILGFMADEVRKVMPDAVRRFGEYDAVNYGMVLRG